MTKTTLAILVVPGLHDHVPEHWRTLAGQVMGSGEQYWFDAAGDTPAPKSRFA
ncbi:hypothetical protein [Ralstonia pseudosolanacearum]|uniref:hypothetical protein n=1 Tax=Ralstonia pseudosolanacearum TaxID=1310165 RepID=UPI003AB0D589